MKPSIKTTLIALLVGLGCLAIFGYFSADNSATATTESAAAKPIYWVAPMDPNYRRDQPGKSPMGMDLVPIFANNDTATKGVVRIDPAVVNNLGVRTALVRADILPSRIETVGYVQFNEDELSHIHPRVEGWIERLFVTTAGDTVVAGEPLYALYSPTLVNAQEELLLALTRKNAVLIDAARERLISLQVPMAAIDRVESAREIARTIIVDAPRSGVVKELAIREGMYVKPGMALMSIASLDQIWVIGEIFEPQAAQVQSGDAVTIHLDFLPGRRWQGRVDYVYPVMNVAARTLRVRIKIDNEDLALRPGMFAKLAIATAEQQPTLVIPREALIRTGRQDRVVLALNEGQFKSVAVQVGAIAGQQVEILAGLAEGDHIVTSAQFLIDSESSKTSDFKRLETPEALMSAGAMSKTAKSAHEHHTMNSVMHSQTVAKPEVAAEVVQGETVSADQTAHDHHQMMGHSAMAVPSSTRDAMDDNGMADHQGMDHAAMQMAPEVSEAPAEVDHQGMDHAAMQMAPEVSEAPTEVDHQEMDHAAMHMAPEVSEAPTEADHQGMDHAAMQMAPEFSEAPTEADHQGMDHSIHQQPPSQREGQL